MMEGISPSLLVVLQVSWYLPSGSYQGRYEILDRSGRANVLYMFTDITLSPLP